MIIRDLTADEIAAAVEAITRALAAAGRSETCPADGCLLIGDDPCPACDVRTQPRHCGCGRRLRFADTEMCLRCLRARPLPKCQCGTEIRTDADQCSRCRRRKTERTYDDSPCPAGWVRRGLIWQPVYEQSEVA